MPPRPSAPLREDSKPGECRSRFLSITRPAWRRRPSRIPAGGAVESFPLSPNWFYSVTTVDGTRHLALSAAPVATIYAQVPAGTVVVPQTPLEVHQAAGAYLWRAREGGGVAGAAMEVLEVQVPTMAAPLIIAEVRKRGAFLLGWSERLQLHGLKVVSPEGLLKATERLPVLLGLNGAGGTVQEPRKGRLVEAS